MIIDAFMNGLPLWSIFILTFTTVLLSIFIGMKLSHLRLQGARQEDKAPIGTVIGATLGLLAFMLAFTFNTASNRFDSRKQLLLDEVNTIGTTHLRSDLLPNDQRLAVQSLLKRYVDIRIEALQSPDKIDALLQESETIQKELWNQAMTSDTNNPVFTGLFVESLNEMIDLHAKRITVGLQYRIPGRIWFGLYAITLLSMTAIGYQFGLHKGTYVKISVILALTFSTVILLIADLDRALHGTLKVSQAPMFELQKNLYSSKK